MADGWPLISLMFAAPLVGTRKRWPEVLHAVRMEDLPIKTWPNGTARSACGLSGLRLMSNDGKAPVPWPPRVAGLAPMVRCQECHELTGRKRPRSTRRQNEEALTRA